MKNPETHKLMKDPRLQERVVQLKNSGEYDNWKEIGKVIEEEFNHKFSINALIETYRSTLATTVTVDKKAKKNFTHLIDTLKERFERMVKRTEVMSQAFDSLISELEDNSEMNTAQKAAAKLKLLDELEKLNKVFIKQMEVVMDEIDKIKIEQSKIVYDDTMVIKKINESLPYILKDLEDKEKITIIDQSILD